MTELPIPLSRPREADPKFVEVLRYTREFMWDGVGRHPEWGSMQYICNAVGAVDALEGGVGRRILAAIALDLYPHSTYSMWLRTQFPHISSSDVEVQAARIRWIDQMICDFGGTP